MNESATLTRSESAPNTALVENRPVWKTNLLLAFALGSLLMSPASPVADEIQAHWKGALFWAVLVALVNLFPVRVRGLYFTLDAPLILGAAFLYPPAIAALIGVVATVDARELRGQIDPSYAVFNRLHTGLSVFLAGFTFHSLAEGLPTEAWAPVVLGAFAALLVDYLVNVVLVISGYFERGGSLGNAAKSLHVGNPLVFLGTYLGYGLIALLLAYLFSELGGWSVVAFLVPIVVAQQMLARTQQLELLAEDLRRRERLIKSLFDRAIDERRDERLRIAGELHDSVLQSLTKIWMLGNELKRETSDSRRALADEEDLVQLADGAIMELRRLMSEMRQSPIGTGGLLPTLENLVRESRLEWQTRIALIAPKALDVDATVQVVTYQVAREGLLNALKHANPNSIRVELREEAKAVRIEVEDDGRGFEVGEQPSLHLGLRLLEERVSAYGGQVEVKSTIGKGTLLRATLPVTRKQSSTSIEGGLVP